MDKPISVGDLVVLVRGHECLMKERAGWTFTVQAIFPQSGGGWRCPRCGAHTLSPNDQFGASSTGKPGKAVPLSFLKRIPPPEELGIVEHDEEITA